MSRKREMREYHRSCATRLCFPEACGLGEMPPDFIKFDVFRLIHGDRNTNINDFLYKYMRMKYMKLYRERTSWFLEKK